MAFFDMHLSSLVGEDRYSVSHLGEDMTCGGWRQKKLGLNPVVDPHVSQGKSQALPNPIPIL